MGLTKKETTEFLETHHVSDYYKSNEISPKIERTTLQILAEANKFQANKLSTLKEPTES